jgi:hypothetical protein
MTSTNASINDGGFISFSLMASSPVMTVGSLAGNLGLDFLVTILRMAELVAR